MKLYLTHLVIELVLKYTHRIWNREISRILCRAYADGLISSEVLHSLASAFDPTQKHHVYGENKLNGFAKW